MTFRIMGWLPLAVFFVLAVAASVFGFVQSLT